MEFKSLPGLVPYEEARELQQRLVELRAQDEIADTVLFLEHRPVITRGRGLQWNGSDRPRHMPLPAVLPEGIEVCGSERGGDLTYHGPGQLVIYPICKLDGKGFAPAHDVEGWIRKLENILIQVLKTYGLEGRSQPGATGVWVGEKKLASVGIAVRKWVSYHGMAINCVNDLSPFRLISPCGFDPAVMMRLADCAPLTSWREELEARMIQKFRNSASREL